MEKVIDKKKYLSYCLLIVFFLAIYPLYATSNPFEVDFDISLGSNDAYLGPIYKDLKKNLSDKQYRWFKYIRPYVDPKKCMRALRQAYKDMPLSLHSHATNRIPRVFHQIWIGPKPFPEKYLRWQRTWQLIPGWTYKLWTEKEIDEFRLTNRAAYEREKNWGARSDIARLEILYREGGVYIDTDFECLKPEMFDVLNSSYDFYAGLTPLDSWQFVINNAIIGSAPGHPILKACIEAIPLQKMDPGNVQLIRRGPGLLTIMAYRHMNKGYRDIIFPPTFFYPLGVDQLKRPPFNSLSFCEDTLEFIKKEVIKPETLAIHWWDGSWGGARCNCAIDIAASRETVMKVPLYAIALFVITLTNIQNIQSKTAFDLTIISHAQYRDSLGRFPIALTRLFKNDLSINFIPTLIPDYTEVPEDIKAILQNPDKTPGKVAILFDILWDLGRTPANLVPQECFIKIAYSMLESTAIPPQWVNLLNEKFDLVAVPDEFYRGVYVACGVKIPIFVMPHGIDIEDFLKEPIKERPKLPFVFGSSGKFEGRKNHETLIKAFHEEFGNNPNVQLKIHGRIRWFDEFNLRALRKELNLKIKKQTKKKSGLNRGSTKLTSNIEIILDSLSSDSYRDFFLSLDCYVLLSKSEGFSVTPREALALGLPCIISNNTAHNTIVQSGCVYPVISNIPEPAYYPTFKTQVGNYFNCSIDDARKALRDVYANYQVYLEKGHEGRKWVQQYLWKNVKAQFMNLIKPKQVIFGEANQITDDYIMTNSPALYEKYKVLQGMPHEK